MFFLRLHRLQERKQGLRLQKEPGPSSLNWIRKQLGKAWDLRIFVMISAMHKTVCCEVPPPSVKVTKLKKGERYRGSDAQAPATWKSGLEFQEPNIKIYQLILVESRRPKHINTQNLNPRVDPTRRFDSICLTVCHWYRREIELAVSISRAISRELPLFLNSSSLRSCRSWMVMVFAQFCTSNWFQLELQKLQKFVHLSRYIFWHWCHWCQFFLHRCTLDFYYSEILPSSHGTAAGRHATVKAPKVYQPQTQGSCRGGHTHTHAHRCLL